MKRGTPGSLRALKAADLALAVLLVAALLVAARDTLRLMASGDKASPKADTHQNSTAPQRTALTSYAPILQNNPFGQPSAPLLALTPDGAGQSLNPAVKLKLMGTIAWSSGKGYAFVIGALAAQQMFKAGEEIPGAGTLVEVHPLHIVMGYRGGTYEVALEEKSAPGQQGGATSASRPTIGARPGAGLQDLARQTGEGEFIVNKRAIDASIQNPRNIMTDARLLPNIERGGQNGFTIMEIRPGGLYETLGLKNGDILLGVNSFKLSSPEAALQAFTALRGMDRIELEIQRGGAKTVLKYNMK